MPYQNEDGILFYPPISRSLLPEVNIDNGLLRALINQDAKEFIKKSNSLQNARNIFSSFMGHQLSPDINVGDIGMFAIDAAPVVGDIKAAEDAVDFYRQDKPGMAALSAAGLLPIIPGITKAWSPRELSIFSDFSDWFKGSKAVDESGNPLIVYHGTGSGSGEITPGYDEPGAWFSSEKKVASNYAKGDKPEIFKTALSIKKPLVVDFDYIDGDLVPIANGKILDIDNNVDIVKYAEKNGYDGVHFTEGNFTEDSETWVVFDKDQIKIIDSEKYY